ncbi:MAG: FkbM family methyltransferase [Henriciella sp.]|jgi:FkbM family methyltransferase|nr:FkbM family methyltransferase [Henriciella sp.]
MTTQTPLTHGPLTATLIGLSRHTPFGRGGMRKLMAKGVRALNPGRPLDVPLYGGRARLHHTGNNSEIKALLSPKRFAREEYEFCQKHMPEKDGVFLDIGGNAGIFSLYVASLMQSGTLIAAEPQPMMFERLKQNFALNTDVSERLNLHLIQTAIGGSEPGTLTISTPESAGQASARLVEGIPTIDVPVTPMTDLLNAHGAAKLDVLKIDVEGFEDSILFPFFETADPSIWPKAIVMEACHAHRWERDCEVMLVENGYRIVYKDRTNMMLVLEDTA